MNAVEIEEAVSDLAARPFEPAEFPFRFLAAFGAKETTVRRLRKGESNGSDVAGGILQRGNIHLAVAAAGEVGPSLAALRSSPRTTSQKARFILATDGDDVEAEDLVLGDALACAYADLGRHFGFFLPLAGISTVKEIKNNPIDVKATGRLNRLYIELLKDNPDWATEARRHALNRFMARLIFCFFAEDTGIFREGSFSATINRMSHAGHGSGEERWGNTHEVLKHLFLAMDTDNTHQGEPDNRHRRAAGIRPWADIFPYVNGGLFTDATECPRFSRTARAYLLRAGELDWKEINPDIFGSMIQAVAEDEERGELGLHYTSVPNILKVLNPLFLDDLRRQLDEAGGDRRRLRALRRRMADIRVFDPACGSGNFLVIAYKQMRAIEAEIVNRLGGEGNLKLDERRSAIRLSSFYGIEIKGFAAEVARLALLIAEFQADCLYLSQQEARAMVLPLHRTGQITVGNALRLDWLEVCPPVTRTGAEQDLAGPTGRLALESAAPDAGARAETYICGNPPYKGTKNQSAEQKEDLKAVFSSLGGSYKALDYVAGWFLKAARYGKAAGASAAFVSTNSVCQGQQVPMLWPLIHDLGQAIFCAHTSFKWSNLASQNAGVTVVIVGIASTARRPKVLFTEEPDGQVTAREADNINPYLIAGDDIIVYKRQAPSEGLARMHLGNQPYEGGYLLLSREEVEALRLPRPLRDRIVRRLLGSAEIIENTQRYCLWIADQDLAEARAVPSIARRIEQVREWRLASDRPGTREMAARPHQFCEMKSGRTTIGVPLVSSESRPYLTPILIGFPCSMTNKSYAIYDGDLFNLSVLSSRLHLIWIAAVCGKLETRLSYSNKMGWNTFPFPKLTERNRIDLTRCAEQILLAREMHFPRTIADLYNPEEMPEDLRRAHDENDEVLERIYIGRRFRNDTERLEKLFELYSRMSPNRPKSKKGVEAE